MNKKHLAYLVCPACKGELLLLEGYVLRGGSIETGALHCSGCDVTYDIMRHVPRFVPLENYASGFGFQWRKHARTQYDRFSGTTISHDRFFNATTWPHDMQGQVILEVGSGAGRFTEQALSTGAMVVSMDYSCAVDANYGLNGESENLLVVQADVYQLPFKNDFFDRLFCFGVLQHTPDVGKAFCALPPVLRSGGSLAVDVYLKRGGLKGLFETKYWVRPVTRRIVPEKLYLWCERYVSGMWPLARCLSRIPYLGRRINWKLLIADHRGALDLSEEQLKEWAVLDTFDMLAPRYDYPQTCRRVQQWFASQQFQQVEVHGGYNGIEGRGVKP